jgi:hypothetical protein
MRKGCDYDSGSEKDATITQNPESLGRVQHFCKLHLSRSSLHAREEVSILANPATMSQTPHSVSSDRVQHLLHTQRVVYMHEKKLLSERMQSCLRLWIPSLDRVQRFWHAAREQDAVVYTVSRTGKGMYPSPI